MAIEDFDDILPHVGSFGPFQKRILLLSLPVNYFLAVVYMAQIYQTLVSRETLLLLFIHRYIRVHPRYLILLPAAGREISCALRTLN